MTAPAGRRELAAQSLAGVAPAPPWPAVWIAWTAVATWRTRHQASDAAGQLAAMARGDWEASGVADLAGIPMTLVAALAQSYAILLLPPIVALLALAAAAAPHLRARRVRSTYRLQPAAGGSLDEIAAFAAAHGACGVEANLLRTDLLAFVYPRGYRRTGLAVFGGLVRLWRSDPDAARAVVAHEVAHISQGDVFALGAVSPFEWVLRRWPAVAAVLVAGPVALAAAASSQSPSAIELAITLAAVGATAAVGLAAALAPAIAAVWGAELAADLAAAGAGDATAVRRVLQARRLRHTGLRWLLHRVSHPPGALRRWAADRPAAATTAATAALPLGWIAQLALLVVNAVLLNTYAGIPVEAAGLRSGVWAWTQSMAPVWLLVGLLVLTWPMLRPAWVRAVGGHLAGASPYPWRAYLVVGLPALALAAIGAL